MYKIIFGHCDIDSHMFFDFNVLAKTRRNHNFNIRPKKTRTNYFKFSFFNRYITDWNSIPSNITHASLLSSFMLHVPLHINKSHLSPIYYIICVNFKSGVTRE